MTATRLEHVPGEPRANLSLQMLADPATQHSGRLEAERKLMLAVLEAAVRDFKAYATAPTGRGRRIFTEADEWFQAPGAGPFTFETICDAVGLDPDFVRGGLRRWHGERRRQPVLVRPRMRAANEDRAVHAGWRQMTSPRSPGRAFCRHE